jgi:hypothetical protein
MMGGVAASCPDRRPEDTTTMQTLIDRTDLRRLTAVLSLVIAATLVLAPAGAVAQDDPPASPVVGAPADGEALIALLPTELAGSELALEEVLVSVGSELLEQSPGAADQYLAITEATGVPVEAMAQVNGAYPVADGIATFGVLQVPGADAREVMEAIIPVALAGMGDDAGREEREIAGRGVTAISPGDVSAPDIVLYTTGDQLWIIFAEGEDFVEAALMSLPE